MIARGAPFHGEFSSADASTAAAIKIYQDGSVTELTSLNANDIISITDVVIVAGSAITVTVFDDADSGGTVSAGERIAFGDFAGSGGMVQAMVTPRKCTKGLIPKVIASASGNVKVTIAGTIERQGA